MNAGRASSVLMIIEREDDIRVSRSYPNLEAEIRSLVNAQSQCEAKI